jgi:hypothetical protein
MAELFGEEWSSVEWSGIVHVVEVDPFASISVLAVR